LRLAWHCRGSRIEVRGFQAYDVSRSAEYLGQSFMTNAYVKVNTDNSVNGWSNWPFSSTEYYWESFPIKVRVWNTISSATAAATAEPQGGTVHPNLTGASMVLIVPNTRPTIASCWCVADAGLQRQ
jgi:hypothetical protein